MTALTLHHDASTALTLPETIAAWRDTGLRQAWQAFARAFGEWFDAWTDPRDEVEAYLARAQNIADLEQRMLLVHGKHSGFGGY